MSLEPGSRLGAYEIVALIGAGGMGEVYRARDTRLKREVAIKVLPDAFASDPDRLARFQREAELLATLNHPNIAQIHGIEGRALVLELVDGPTLAERIAQGRLPLDEALPIAGEIARALEAADDRGIIHRDLKPANIKLTRDGHVKVLDFGLAKAVDAASGARMASPDLSHSPTITSPAMTVGGAILGTAAYMSPEQARGKTLDRRVDIWAFGCVLFEMLTGRRPFDVGDTAADALVSILKNEPQWDRLAADTPQHIRTLLVRCLQKDPQKRLPHIGVARLEIDEPLDISPDQPQRFSLKRATWLIGAATVIVAVAVVVTTLSVDRRSRDSVVTRLDIATPPTTDPFSFALAPDGRQIVYSANTEKGAQLWLRRLDRTQEEPIAGTDGGFSPFWSPDGRFVAFFADGKLKRVDFTGARPEIIADAPAGRGGTWHENGSIVFAPSPSGGLVRMVVPQRVVTRVIPEGSNYRWPQFLPNGRRILSHLISGGSATQGTVLISLDDGTQETLLQTDTAAAYAAPGYLLRVSQGILVAQQFDPVSGALSGEAIPLAQGVASDNGTSRSAFSVSSTGVLAYRSGVDTRRQLVWVDRTGGVLGVLGSPQEDSLANPALSPDGRQVAAQRTRQENIDIWLLDVERGVESRFTNTAGPEASPVWSPDGSSLVFRSRRDGRQDLFHKPTAGPAEQVVASTAQDESPADWSADGNFLLFTAQDQERASDIWAIPIKGDRKPFPVVRSGFDEIQPVFSTDAHWLAYASNESGRYEVYVHAFRGDLRWQVSTAGGSSPRWSRSGHELYYVAPDSRLMAVPLPRSRTVGFTPGPPVALFRTRLAAGSNIDSRGYLARAQYAVAADGRFLMNVREGDLTPPIRVVLNWTAELPK